ncbi:hypothetical protein MSG28_011286, partial [Choristoneura fumiferana]
MQAHAALRDVPEDQLSLASVHYLRAHYQEAIDVYKKLLLEKRAYLALNVYVALCYYKLDYYDVYRKRCSVYLAQHPSSTRGGYPPIMRRRIDVISKRQGFFRSRLPTFTKEEVDMIRGSYDFLGLNHYTTNLVKPGDGRITAKPSFYNDMGVKLIIVPWGLRKTLNWIRHTYDNPSVVITENGVSFEKGLKDRKRINYIDSYLRSVHAAIYKDNCDVIANYDGM